MGRKKLQLETTGGLGLRFEGHVVETEAAGNIKPSKKRSTERIDGIVAACMALGRAIATPPEQTGSMCDVL